MRRRGRLAGTWGVVVLLGALGCSRGEPTDPASVGEASSAQSGDGAGGGAGAGARAGAGAGAGDEAEAIRRALASERPNIVLVTIDTLRADRIAAYGATDIETPAFDRLSAEGIRFSNAASTVPFTLPAHSSIMTGTYPPFHGVRENVGYYLDPVEPTLAERLRTLGYDTAGFVSAFVLDRRWGIARGFDRYFDDFDLGEIDGASLGSVQRDGTVTLEEALSWLRARPTTDAGDSPFFAWLHFFDPHDPYEPPEPWHSQYPGRPYEGEVAYADSLLGRLLDELAELSLLESTAIVVTADHGEGLGDHGEAFHGYFVYDSTIHVPLLVRLPGALAAGRVVDDAVSHVDILPTVLDLVGADPAPTAQGRTLLETLETLDTSSEREPRAVYSESYYPLHHYGWAPIEALRQGRFKLVSTPEPELFDLVDDPSESRNLVRELREESRALNDRLEDLSRRLGEGATTAAAQPDLDEETLAQLRALGYVAGRASRPTDDDVERPDPKGRFHLHQLIMRAQSRIGAGATDRAGELLEQALEEDADLLDAHQMLGSIALEDSAPADAVDHFQRAIELDDRHQPSLFGLASAFRDLGRLDDAVLGYERLLDVAGQDSKATLAIADLEMGRDRPEAAFESLSRAVAADGTPALVHNRYGEVLVLQGRQESAETAFRNAIATNDRLTQPHYNLAVVLEERGRYDDAVAAYKATIERAPRHFQAQFNLGRLYGRLGRPTDQESLYRAAIESNPRFAMGRFLLGKHLMENGGDLDEAESQTRAGLKDQDSNPLGWFVLTDILNRQGRSAEARQSLARARDLDLGTGQR